MKNHLYLSDEDQNSVPRSACWWRTGEEFDENGHLKMEISCLPNLTPRLKVLREMERLAMIATEGLDELRHKLLSYRAGDFWMPIGGIKKKEMAIPAVITILLTGVTGSGKSSLVNMMYSVLGRCGLIPFAQTSGEASDYSTMYLEEHNVLRSPRSGFCVYDTMGLDKNQMDEGLREVSTWMCDGVRHNQPCYRDRTGDEKLHRGSTTGPGRKGLDMEWCKAPEAGLLAPDVVIYLDVSPEKASERGGYGGESYEQVEFQKKVAQSYRMLWDSTWKIVDGALPMEEVEQQLKQIVYDCVVSCKQGKPLSQLWCV